MEDGRAERDEGVGHVVVGRLHGARAVAAREGHEPEIDVELDACGRARALALIETIDSRADPQPAKLLALRRYLRLGGAKVVAQWAWTAEETLAKSKEGTTKLLYDEAAKVQTKFAEQNVGCSLAVSPLRDLRKQVGLWNKNNTIQQAGEKLMKDMQTAPS